MEKTYDELKTEGIIKVENHQMLNAVSECYVNGGEKGIWIDGQFWKRISHADKDRYQAPTPDAKGR